VLGRQVTRALGIAIIATASFVLGLAGRSARAGSLEYAVKAAFLFNFAKFVEWPRAVLAPNQGPLVICVLGADPFGEDLDDITRGRSVQNHPIQIRRLPLPRPASTTPAGPPAAECTILFVSHADVAAARKLLNSLRDSPVLTVGEDQDFTADGGCLRFFLADEKVRFEINLQAIDRAHLKVSSKLLSLAQVMRRP
jgi:hypothetical protein